MLSETGLLFAGLELQAGKICSAGRRAQTSIFEAQGVVLGIGPTNAVGGAPCTLQNSIDPSALKLTRSRAV